MVTTDPIADMLTRIRNAYQATHKSVEMPSSKMKQEIARVLKEEGYIVSFEVKKKGDWDFLELVLNYGPNNEKGISGIKRISKPGLRVYAGKDQLPRVLGGLGIAVLSTSHGIMTNNKARKENVGGEVLAFVW
jgi:small subunit ribosomal protein S8